MPLTSNSLIQEDSNGESLYSSSIPSTRDAFLTNFKNLCSDFYVKGDVTAGELVGLVEFAKKTPEKVELNWEAMGSLKSSQAELEQGLTTIGFLRGNMIYPEDWSLYLKEKNEIRSTWHKNNQLKIQQEFYQLILTTQFQTLSIFERVRKFRRFLSVWSGDLGAAPFIKGLKRMLETQFTKDFLFTWSLLDDTLTQAGPEFMRDSVTLLLSVFGFTQYVDLENAGRGEGDGDQAGVVRVWQMNDDMSDIQLDRLLSLFPNERSLPGRMSGNIQVGSTRRAAELVIKSTLLKYLIHWPGRWILWVAQLFSDLQHGSG